MRGVNGRVVRGIRGAKGDRERGLGREKVWEVLKSMKDLKAAGVDGIPAEVWKYGGEMID